MYLHFLVVHEYTRQDGSTILTFRGGKKSEHLKLVVRNSGIKDVNKPIINSEGSDRKVRESQ